MEMHINNSSIILHVHTVHITHKIQITGDALEITD